jgi:hypothetical protein
VAILHSYDSRWAIDGQRHNRNFDPVGLLLSYYRPDDAAECLTEYVNGGGHLVLGPRSGIRMRTMLCRSRDNPARSRCCWAAAWNSITH